MTGVRGGTRPADGEYGGAVHAGLLEGGGERLVLRKGPVSPRPGRCSTPGSCAPWRGIRCSPPRGRTCVRPCRGGHGPSTSRSWPRSGLSAWRCARSRRFNFSLHQALSGSRWDGHRVPVANGRQTPGRSDVALLQRLYGGSLEDLSVRGEAGAVAPAFPCLLRTVEGQHAAEVGAAGRDRVELAVLVAVNGASTAARPYHGTLAARDVLRCRTCQGWHPVADEVTGHVGLMLQERPAFADHGGQTARIVEPAPLALASADEVAEQATSP